MPQPENRLGPVNIDSESNDEVLALELDAIEIDGAEFDFTEGRSISSRTFSRLVRTKCSLTADFSMP